MAGKSLSQSKSALVQKPSNLGATNVFSCKCCMADACLALVIPNQTPIIDGSLKENVSNYERAARFPRAAAD
jgi:hypothetical protein